MWRYEQVTFAVVGDKSFVWASIPFKDWYHNTHLKTAADLDLVYFLVDALERVDPKLSCLASISQLPTKPLREGSTVKLISNDPVIV